MVVADRNSVLDQPYTNEFYEQFREGSRESARQIVPLVLEMVDPRSVIDIGCGVGTWLSVFEEHGVTNVTGVDGDYVENCELQISPKKFVAFDLRKGFKSKTRFDLAMSLEVAEHIPAENAETYIDSLANLAPVLLFSAAIPFQEGQNHVNEQWPDYWASRFEQRGFVVVDCIRPRIWQNSKIEWWYAQNVMLFVRRDRLDDYPALKEFSENLGSEPMAMVHPRLFLYKETRLAQFESENEYLKKRLEQLHSPMHVLANLPRFARRKVVELFSRRRAETR